MAQRNLARMAAGLVLGALVLSSRAARSPTSEPRPAPTSRRAWPRSPTASYDAGIEELKKAYDILPHPNVLYNIARAYVDQGDLENAVAYYKKYLEGNPKDRDEVAQIVAALEARIRKQQAELLESQQAQAPPGGPAARARAAADPAPGATGRATRRRAPARAPIAGRAARAERRAAGARSAEARLKTEEVFEETVVTASEGGPEPPRRAQLHVDHHRAGHPPLGHHEDPRAPPAPRRRRHHGDHGLADRGLACAASTSACRTRCSSSSTAAACTSTCSAPRSGRRCPIGVEDIERIEVVRGPGSALYGADAFNGVINIITKAPGEGGSGFNVGYGDHNTTHGTVCGERPRQGDSRTACRPATTTCRAGAARSRRAAPT